MEMISRQKKRDAKFGTEIPENSPRCIILVPTKELVQQVKVQHLKQNLLCNIKAELIEVFSH